MRSVPETIKQLIVINIIFYLGSQFLGDLSYDILALHYFENDKFLISQLITHMFMHGSPSHILFNMFGLWMFGSPLEQMWGKQKFLFFYFSAGLGAAALQMFVYNFQVQTLYDVIELNNLSLTNPDLLLNYMSQSDYNQAVSSFNSVMVGASGAIYGILVAFAFSFPNSKLMLLFPPIPIKAKYFVPLLILIDLFFGLSSFSIGSIAHFAHIGGALIGLIMVLYWKKNQFNSNRWD
ncbi:rhomboid family intramembrane serine protease [Flavobacteriaceae bacterium]|jgi:membrane associated rhomboid family serine protease|nr:rhomboid family intramembrane serine protease [Flavobacteriaceae bacterium]MDA9318835.1 rhomboid family intramembrane serine protease [Flavobacteriaceae bacterium]MDB0042431.1 rhomboid family intramembrane serine protease [Flavobacteriaceae bacterium]MDB0069273.1 rhomboid family intramembrane serine protease [Flavobacteriaceae bacterium]MDB4093315.1 rhomboid family intramembrane serine protease [Flavobacteriaceae bacterium]|tara:strand:- start:1062 stop:1769 length:708 start_codon:yes stop_codon:yes gene_type:complete